jgi:hypothetical protein
MKKFAIGMAALACFLIGVGIGNTQDTTTLLSYFLTDLRAGFIGTNLSTGFKSKDGLSTAPGYGFASETNTGMYRAGTNSLGFTVNSTVTASMGAGTFSLSASGGSFQLGGIKSIILTAPTISSGFGTSPAILSNAYSSTFRVNVGTGGAATSGVIGLPTASNGWNCQVTDMTTNIVTRQTASNTTTVTVTAASAWTASDTLLFNCAGY